MPLSHNNSLAVALGNLTIVFSKLEFIISNIIWRMVNREQAVGQIITAEMSFRNLIRAFESLSQYSLMQRQNPPETQRFAIAQQLAKRAYSLEQQRNTYIHSLWTTGFPQENIIHRVKFTAKRQLDFQITPTTLTEMDALVTDVDKLTGDFMMFMSDVITIMSPP